MRLVPSSILEPYISLKRDRTFIFARHQAAHRHRTSFEIAMRVYHAVFCGSRGRNHWSWVMGGGVECGRRTKPHEGSTSRSQTMSSACSDSRRRPPTNPPAELYESDGSGRVEGDTIPDTFACICQPAVLS